MATNSGKPAHVLVFPFPAQGHMLPMLDFTYHLALRGLNVTVLVTPKNLPTLSPLLSSHPSIQPLVFPFPDHPSVPAGVENVKDIGNSGNIPIIGALSKLRDPVIQWFKSQLNPPIAIISDFFLGWTYHLAHQIGIPRIAFYSSGAFLAGVLDHLWQNLEHVRSLTAVDFSHLPSSPSMTREHLPSAFLRYMESDPDWEIFRDGITRSLTSWGCVLNTFNGVEAQYLDYLRQNVAHERVYGVGPVHLIHSPENSDASNAVFSWLDGCPDGSVLYVCFGSQKLLTKAQMEALAIGLEQTGVRFVWVVKPLTAQQLEEGYGSVPDGFEQSVSGRGLIVKGWASQVAILSHRAVGGFLSHCGWNSVLEAIVAGVLILGWPMEADQFVNAKLLVDKMRVAVRVCEGGDTVPDSAELAQSITEAMHGSSIEKAKSRELRDKAIEAVKVAGNSARDLDELVRQLSELQLTRVFEQADQQNAASFEDRSN